MLPQKILVTGGFGYVGSRLVPHLLHLGHSVRVLDLMLYGTAGHDALKADSNFPQWSQRFELLQGDLREGTVVNKAVTGIDTIIHLAAISNDPTGEMDEVLTRQVNFDAIGQLLTLAKKAGVSRFINGSSSSVFGLKEEQDITEILEPEPLTFYSKYKMLSEWLVIAAASNDFCTVNIRPATICGYSPRQRFDLTVNKLTADALRKGIITVHGGQQRRPNIGMNDAINLYSLLTQMDQALINGKTFNFGFENHKIIDIARIIQAELSDLPVEIQITNTLDQRDYHISSQKILQELGYQPVSSIRAEVAELRRVLESGMFPNIDAPEFYNMQTMNLDKNPGCYELLFRA